MLTRSLSFIDSSNGPILADAHGRLSLRAARFLARFPYYCLTLQQGYLRALSQGICAQNCAARSAEVIRTMKQELLLAERITGRQGELIYGPTT
jgi:hypothetical protein